MEPHEKIYRNKKRIFIDNFIGGIAWGLGATIGLAVVLAIFGLIFNNLNLVPYIGDFVGDIIYYIQNNHQLVK